MFPAEQRMAPLALIVAMGAGGVIGKDGGMPWHEPADLRFFRRTTMGHAILMGRVTFASIGRPLPGRRNLILSRQEDLVLEGCEVFHRFEDALVAARTEDACPFVIGGAKIYQAAMPLATRLYLTEIGYPVEGDTFFPAYDKEQWQQVSCEEVEGKGGALRFLTMARR
ncbi:MAG: dihydrofolate reductase [Myxococcales bacterium]|nr:dihydrofolate reductase [Myxococcales bacterium]